MKILIATDSYKGCMSSVQAAQAIQKGILQAMPQAQICIQEMADGGEGTAKVLCSLTGAKSISIQSVNCFGAPCACVYGLLEESHTAIMDVAECIGLNKLSQKERNVMASTSKGVGIMMRHAICQGAKTLIIGLGGSCTNDGGMGILEAFGAVFYNSRRKPLFGCAANLEKIAFIDKRRFDFPKDVQIIVAADVKNHLLGSSGATYVYGPQKGLFKNQLPQVEAGMAHYRNKIEQTFHVDINKPEGSGAAGGIGAVLLGLMHGQKASGFELVADYAHLKERIAWADVIITGEGQSDGQTLFGKVPMGVASMAKAQNKPCLCLSGALSKGYEKLYDVGCTAIFSSMKKNMSFEQILSQGESALCELAYSLFAWASVFVKEEV
jgi:glycerate kinase